MTLNQTIAKFGEARIQQAINDQREWLTVSKHKDVCALFAEHWKINPRSAMRWAYFVLGVGGFKSGTDSYLLMAYALGKLPFVR